jgi:hypothetical protein
LEREREPARSKAREVRDVKGNLIDATALGEGCDVTKKAREILAVHDQVLEL